MSLSPSTSDYAGDVTVTEAWELVSQGAVLVDVRTVAEWSFVGLPDLTSLGRTVARVEWQSFVTGQQNLAFVSELTAALGGDKTQRILFLCRSGARSRAAAIAMTAAGYQNCFNVAGGFEGDLDQNRHRGRTNGWKAEGLPWAQT